MSEPIQPHGEDQTMRDKTALPLLLLGAGLTVTGVHDYAYRRGGGADFELWGLLSHAGSDMIILTVVLAIAAALWLHHGPRR